MTFAFSLNNCNVCTLQKSTCDFVSEIPGFEFLTFENLMRESEPLTEPDEPYWMNFAQKKERPGTLKPP